MRHEDEDVKVLLTQAVPPLTPPADRLGAVARRVRRRRQRLVAGSALTVALAVALGVGGMQVLTGNHAPPPRPAGDSGGDGRWTSCAEAAPEMARPGFGVTAREAAALPRLGSDFTPSVVVICGQETQRRAGGGEDMVATERRSDDVAALVTALRLPDEPGVAEHCTMEMPGAPWLAVVDAGGRWLRPGIPVDTCGKLRPEVGEALAALRLTTVSARPVAQLESDGAAAAGCSQRWKDVLSLEAARTPGPRSTALPQPFPAGQRVRLCVYQVPKGAQGSDGEFAHGTVLPTDRRTAIERALTAAGPVAACSERASRFALLWSVTGGEPQTYVELDGCHRVMLVDYPGAPIIAQGDAALAELIDKP